MKVWVRMRKKLLLLLSVALLVSCVGALQYWSQQREVISYAMSGEEKLGKIRQDYRKTGENILTDLRFNQVTLVQDVASGTFYLPLDMKNESWEPGELTSGQEDVQILFGQAFTRDDKQTAIREGTPYEFLAVKGDCYRSYYLVFTGLPIVSIETEATAEEEIFGGTVRFWEADSKRDWAYSNILEAHIRGNTSRLYPKKGYKLTLKTQDRDGNVVKDKRALFGLRKDDEYILNAMYTDASKIRDKFCADIWGGLGARTEAFPNMYLGTRVAYVEVFFNGEYWGLYGLMEPVDAKQLDLNREGEDAHAEYAYKSSAPQNMSLEELKSTLIWEKEMAGYKLKGKYSQVTRESWQPLLDYLSWREEPSDEVFAEKAGEMVDADNMMRIWVYLQAVMGIDNRVKNMYYVTKYGPDGYHMYLAPWDMDLTLGDTLQDPIDLEYPWDVGQSPLIYRERINFTVADRLLALDAEDCRNRVSAIWQELRQGGLSDENIEKAVDELAVQVVDSGAMKREEKRWPKGKHWEDYGKLKMLLRYRMELLDGYFYDNIEAYLDLGYA